MSFPLSKHGCSFAEIGNLRYDSEEEIIGKLEEMRIKQATWAGEGGTTAIAYVINIGMRTCVARLERVGFKLIHTFPGTHNSGSIGIFIFEMKIDVPVIEQVKLKEKKCN